MSLRKKSILGAKWTTIQQSIGQVIDFSVFILLARSLGPEEFGLVALAAVFIAFMGPFVSQGLGAAIVQRLELEPEHLDTAFWLNLLIAFLLMIILILSARWISGIFSEPQLEDVLTWLSVSFIFTSLTTVQQALLRREMKFKQLALRTLSAKIAGGSIGVLLAINGFGVWSLVARQLLSTFVSVFLLWWVSDWRPRCRVSVGHIKDLYPFGLRMLGNDYLVFMNRRSDNFVIGYFLGSLALGYYNVAYRFMTILFGFVSKAVEQVGMPAFARLQKDPERLKAAFYEVTQMIALIAIPAFLGVMVLVPEIVVSALGEKWAPSIPVLQVLVLIGVMQCLLSPMVAVLIGAGKPGLRLKLQLIDAVINLIGFLIAVHWGIVAVAMSYVIVGYLMSPIWFWAVSTVIPIHLRDYLKLVIGPLIGSAVMIVCVVTFKWALADVIGTSGYLILSVLMGASIYTAVIYLMYREAANKLINTAKSLFNKPD